MLEHKDPEDLRVLSGIEDFKDLLVLKELKDMRVL